MFKHIPDLLEYMGETIPEIKILHKGTSLFNSC